MGHFAKIADGKVVSVIVAEPEFFDTFVDSSPGQWIQTSYNTRGGVHYNPETGEPSADQSKALRGNYAGVSSTYDATNDVFYPPQPYPSWTLDSSWSWQSPVPYPDDGKQYGWDESVVNWVEVQIEQP
jgi:hypothetical protein